MKYSAVTILLLGLSANDGGSVAPSLLASAHRLSKDTAAYRALASEKDE
jgi:hypothetical protein